MNRPQSFLRSTVGLKIVMALSGIVLFGFVVGHMIGNLQVYMGREAINGYGVFLRTVGHGGALWVARAVLLACVFLHIYSAYRLTRISWAARPAGYRVTAWRESTYASRTMRWGGVIIAVFIVYHLLHFTFGPRFVHPDFRHGDVFHNFVVGFQNPLVSGFYILAMLLLGLHLYHGVWSMMQTLGLSHPRYNHLRHAFATLIAVIVVVGNISFPVAVLTGVLSESRPAPLQHAAASADLHR